MGNNLLVQDAFSTGVGLVATTTKVQRETIHDIQPRYFDVKNQLDAVTESVKDEGKTSVGQTQSPTMSECPMTTILLIGKTGNGKSSVGNTILEAKVIATSDPQHQQENTDHFKIGVGMWSTTQTVSFHQMTYKKKMYKVIDTPDISEMDKDKEQEETQRWKKLLCGQANVFVLCVRCDVRYTAEEFSIYNKLKKSLGSFFNGRLMIAFTFGDRQKEDITKELNTVCKELKKVLVEADGQYVVFDNTASRKDKESTRKTFFEIVRSLEQRNGAKIPKEKVAAEDQPQLQEHSQWQRLSTETLVDGIGGGGMDTGDTVYSDYDANLKGVKTYVSQPTTRPASVPVTVALDFRNCRSDSARSAAATTSMTAETPAKTTRKTSVPSFFTQTATKATASSPANELYNQYLQESITLKKLEQELVSLKITLKKLEQELVSLKIKYMEMKLSTE